MIALEGRRKYGTVIWSVAALGALWAAWAMILRVPHGRGASGYDAGPAAGSEDVRITDFYAGAAQLPRGDSASLCYAVANARSVRLEPPVEAIRPSYGRCISIAPAVSTTYTLWAKGADGREISRSVKVAVGPSLPQFILLAISSKEIKRGESLAICYGVKNAASVRLAPAGMTLPPAEKQCFQFYPAVTTEYTLTASSADGGTASEKFVVKVR